MRGCCCFGRRSASFEFAGGWPDRRDPDRVRHATSEVTARTPAIACGHREIGLDRPRHDPLMKIAVGRCPRSGGSADITIDDQPAGECAEQHGGGSARPASRPAANAHEDERGFASMHVYHELTDYAWNLY